MMLSGVAMVVPSTTLLSAAGTAQVVMMTGQDAMRKALAASAGFKKFFPRPPKSCFTMTMEKAAPTMGIHQGAPTGMTIAIRTPVTQAER